MSALFPLYALGALAIAVPLVLHLIRRSPQGEVPFSSLMFLVPSPPRVTRRSRLDHILLLLLRAAAIALLAAAFARPFFRSEASVETGAARRHRVVVLIDTSASMRRDGLWEQAKARADRALAACGPADRLAVLAFDATARPVLSFGEARTLDPARRLAVARSRIEALTPTWGATRLGQALVEALAAIEDAAEPGEDTAAMPGRIVLVGDLPQGSQLEALGEREWPADVELELATVAAVDPTNAGLQPLVESAEALAAAAEAGAEPGIRVRVTNDAGSDRENFTLRWVGPDGAEVEPGVSAYVPPGESRVVRVAPPVAAGPGQPAPTALRLSGDGHPFDNTLHLAVEARERSRVLYVGPDAADDPAGLLYYLGRVFEGYARRAVRVEPVAPAEPIDWPPADRPALIVLAGEAGARNADRLRGFVEEGGTLLAVLTAPGSAATLGAVAGVAPPEVAEAAGPRDQMLGEIAFDHPLFTPLAGAQFNDFTRIRFWKHRVIDPAALGGEARVLARFEDGSPALLTRRVGKGDLYVLASGWGPADGQLARSSKFVPLMTTLLEGPGTALPGDALHRVGDRVPLPAAAASEERSVRKPDGTSVTIEPGSDRFDGADAPGVYAVEAGGVRRPFAVNLDPAESRTAPLPPEALEQLGCRLAGRTPRSEERAREQARQLYNAELENRQQLWRWPMLAAIGVLIVETLVAGRRGRTRPVASEASQS